MNIFVVLMKLEKVQKYIAVGQRTRGPCTRKRDRGSGPGNQDLDIKQQDQARDQRTRTGTKGPEDQETTGRTRAWPNLSRSHAW